MARQDTTPDRALMSRTLLLAALTTVVVVSARGVPQDSQGGSVPPPVGRLVDIGGRRLHQICSGTGSPVVVIENGAASFSVEWSLTQAEVAKFTQVCSYDRAGYAWSDTGPAQDAVEETVDDLHLLLQRTVKPPYVLVGASLGAIYTRAYQRRFPEQIRGIVFVDGTHDEGVTFMSRGTRVPISMLSASDLEVAYAQYERDAPRPNAGRPDQEPFDRLPPELQRARYWAFEKLVKDVGLLPKGIAAAESWRQEFTALRRQRLAAAHPLGNLPLVVLERGADVDATWHAQQAELAALSASSRLVHVAGSGHMIHMYKPDVVAEAIREVVTRARQRQARG
jgi:pimeloyl-ACP methyl ester carboxylesterase